MNSLDYDDHTRDYPGSGWESYRDSQDPFAHDSGKVALVTMGWLSLTAGVVGGIALTTRPLIRCITSRTSHRSSS